MLVLIVLQLFFSVKEKIRKKADASATGIYHAAAFAGESPKRYIHIVSPVGYNSFIYPRREKRGYPGIAAASSGKYGAAVVSQAAKQGLGAFIVQEAFDSRGVEQPEIAEKTRACEAYGAEVLRLSVGSELFYQFLLVLEESGYFSALIFLYDN